MKKQNFFSSAFNSYVFGGHQENDPSALSFGVIKVEVLAGLTVFVQLR